MRDGFAPEAVLDGYWYEVGVIHVHHALSARVVDYALDQSRSEEPQRERDPAHMAEAYCNALRVHRSGGFVASASRNAPEVQAQVYLSN